MEWPIAEPPMPWLRLEAPIPLACILAPEYPLAEDWMLEWLFEGVGPANLNKGLFMLLLYLVSINY